MFCPKCGYVLPDGESRCPNCGYVFSHAREKTGDDNYIPTHARSSRPVSQERVPHSERTYTSQGSTTTHRTTSQHSNSQGGYHSSQRSNQRKNEASSYSSENRVIRRKKKKPPTAGILTILVLVVVLVGIFMFTRAKTIDMEDFLSFTFEGYDGFGIARIHFDESSLIALLEENAGIDEADLENVESKEKYMTTVNEYGRIHILVDSISIDMSGTNGNFKNGDTVKAVITYDNELAKEMKLKLSGKTFSAKVKGLPDITNIDPFEHLNVTFSGVSPNCTAELSYLGTEEFIDVGVFKIDRPTGLRNGDTITVSIPWDDNFTGRQGYIATVKEKTYTVSVADEYVLSTEAITGEFFDSLKNDAEDYIYAQVAQTYLGESQVSELTYSGYIFKAVKSGEILNPYNQLYIIMRGIASNSEGKFNDTEIFFPVCFENIMSQSGALKYESGGRIRGFAELGGYATSDGFSDPVLAYDALSKEDADRYNIEAGDGFEIYKEYRYIASLSDIPEDFRDSIIDTGMGIVTDYISRNYESHVIVDDLISAGEYLLVTKNQEAAYAPENSKYYAIFSATVYSNDDFAGFPPVTIYYPVGFQGMTIVGDGSCRVSMGDGLIGYINIPESYLISRGYLDASQMYRELISANRGNYEYDISDSLSAFGD